MVSLDVAIVAHPQRGNMACDLAAKTEAARVVLDSKGIGCEANHVRALQLAANGGLDWLVILEDDAIPVDDFRAHVGAALGCARSPLVSLYVGTGHNAAVQAALRAACADADSWGAAWLRSDALTAGVGYAVHRSVVCRLLDAIDKPEGPELPRRITAWAQAAHVQVHYTWPSLVDHKDGWSTIAQADIVGRRAHCHGTRSRWDTGAVAVHIPGWSKPAKK